MGASRQAAASVVAPTAAEPGRLRASDVKQRGWRGVMRAVREEGIVVVTNHDEPEAYILDVQRYEALQEAARRLASHEEAALDELRRRFDERLEALSAVDAADRLRSAARKPARLGGKVKAGKNF